MRGSKYILRASLAIVCALTISLSLPLRCSAYAVLAHEAIIDAAWESHLKPLLHQKYPHVTDKELTEAQAYAYGGAIIQDMGYYPHGSHLFSDLTHYVRSGDFIQALLKDASNVDEYAFALGALSHYAADNDGHRMATNRAVPILYPRLHKKYGETVSYEDDPLAHVKTEFGFDVMEVAQQSYAPTAYHNFIGFQVSRELLDRAFEETYGLRLADLLSDEDKALNSYRHAISTTIPAATRIAWSLKKDEIKQATPGMTKKKFRYNLSRSNYEKEWGRNYQQPTFNDKFLAFLYKLLPKFGPLRVLQFKTPTPETQRMFQASFNSTMDRYRLLLDGVKEGRTTLPNDNFDVGETTGPGKYRLNDEAHAKLLDKLAEQKFTTVPSEVRAELLDFYSDPAAAYSTKLDPKAWTTVQTQLELLKAAQPAPAQSSSR